MFVLIILLLFYRALNAQVKTLPYKNAFETAADRTAFVSVRTGATATSDWSYNTGPNSSAYHDYPVGGSATDTVSDWLFSPPIKVTSGAVLSFKYYVYGITGSATPSDEFSIWYGKSTMNPKNGKYVKLLDLTDKISTSSVWKDTSGIALPFAADTGYVVFRYRATNNWLTLALDSIVVKMPGLSVDDLRHGAVNVQIYPNPGNEILNVSINKEIQQIDVMEIDGRVIYTSFLTDKLQVIPIATWQTGTYLLRIKTDGGVVYRTWIKN